MGIAWLNRLLGNDIKIGAAICQHMLTGPTRSYKHRLRILTPVPARPRQPVSERVLTFIEFEGVPPDNNYAERDPSRR